MGVTFCGNFASGTLLVPFHWRGMCYAHQFSREGSLCVREAEETAPDPVGLHKLNFNHTCCAGHRNNDTARRHLARSAYLLFLRFELLDERSEMRSMGLARASYWSLRHFPIQGRDCGAAEIQRITENAPRWPDMNA